MITVLWSVLMCVYICAGQPQTEEQVQHRVGRLLKRERVKQEKLNSMGIDFDVTTAGYVLYLSVLPRDFCCISQAKGL